MTKEEIADIRHSAFMEAAHQLLSTADDYSEMANRLKLRNEVPERDRLLDKAQLLQGQAKHIQRMK